MNVHERNNLTHLHTHPLVWYREVWCYDNSTEFRGLAMKFMKWIYCKPHTCLLTAYCQ